MRRRLIGVGLEKADDPAGVVQFPNAKSTSNFFDVLGLVVTVLPTPGAD